MMSAWQLQLSDGSNLGIDLADTKAGTALQALLKHLRHIPIPFDPTLDNPYGISLGTTRWNLVKCAKNVGLDLDVDRLEDQRYLNHLHEVYEKNYDGDRRWLPFHENIHAYELLMLGIRPDIAWVDWKELAGRMEQPVAPELWSHMVSEIHAGDVFVAYAELGKPLYTYWRDGEPDDIQRMATLAAPWRSFKPRIGIALADRQLHPDDWDDFVEWFTPREQQYWQQLGLEPRPIEHQQCVLPVGNMPSWQELKHKLLDGTNITRMLPC